jgi:ribosomal protein S18 acetylase RimI-like enzyme
MKIMGFTSVQSTVTTNMTQLKFTIRVATIEDVPAIFSLILALADYEKLSDKVIGNIEALQEDMFGAKPCIEALVAAIAPNQQIVGFALFFTNYSTFLTRKGIYLEDLFVLSEYRGMGLGKALITNLAKIAVARGCGRFEWSVLDWNEPAIAFYRRIGAEVLPDWRICRVTGDSLGLLASQ